VRSWRCKGAERAATELGAVTSVGARRRGQHGACGARQKYRRTDDEVGGARSRNEALAARRSLAVVAFAHGSWRDDVRAGEKQA
jgi:hypothetical protein